MVPYLIFSLLASLQTDRRDTGVMYLSASVLMFILIFKSAVIWGTSSLSNLAYISVSWSFGLKRRCYKRMAKKCVIISTFHLDQFSRWWGNALWNEFDICGKIPGGFVSICEIFYPIVTKYKVGFNAIRHVIHMKIQSRLSSTKCNLYWGCMYSSI